jgi:hypothetical protein
MSVLKDFEVKVLHLLASGVLPPEHLASIAKAGELESYDYTGCGYFLTLRHPSLPDQRIACHTPFVTGSADGVTCGFIIFIENGRLTIECHPWGDPDVPEDFREKDVQVAAI